MLAAASILFLNLFLLAPSMGLAANVRPSTEQHCYVLLGATTKEDAVKGKTSPVLQKECYATAAAREKAHPLSGDKNTLTSFSQKAIQPASALSGTPLITFYSDEYTLGSSYRIDGYNGCSSYYYVNSLDWMNANAESLWVWTCRPYQRVHVNFNLTDSPPTLGPWDVDAYETHYGSSPGKYVQLGNYANVIRSWETT